MMTLAPCLTPDGLRRLADGLLSEAEEADASSHLGTCRACATAYDGTSDPLVAALRGGYDWPAFGSSGLVDRLKNLILADSTLDLSPQALDETPGHALSADAPERFDIWRPRTPRAWRTGTSSRRTCGSSRGRTGSRRRCSTSGWPRGTRGRLTPTSPARGCWWARRPTRPRSTQTSTPWATAPTSTAWAEYSTKWRPGGGYSPGRPTARSCRRCAGSGFPGRPSCCRGPPARSPRLWPGCWSSRRPRAGRSPLANSPTGSGRWSARRGRTWPARPPRRPAATAGRSGSRPASSGPRRLLPLERGKVGRSLGDARNPISSLLFSTDDRLLICGSRGRLCVSDTATGAEAWATEVPGNKIWYTGLSQCPGGTLLASNGRGVRERRREAIADIFQDFGNNNDKVAQGRSRSAT